MVDERRWGCAETTDSFRSFCDKSARLLFGQETAVTVIRVYGGIVSARDSNLIARLESQPRTVELA